MKLIFVPTMVTINNCQCFVNQYLILYEADFVPTMVTINN